jgi:hypothetical protein
VTAAAQPRADRERSFTGDHGWGAALNEPIAQRVLSKVLDRLDAQPAEDRSLDIRIDLDGAMAPEIHHAETLADRDVAWATIDGLAAAGWARLGYRLHRRHGAREEREPYLDFRWSRDVEDFIRTKLCRPRRQPSYAAQWRALVEASGLDMTEAARAQISTTPIMVPGRPVGEVFQRFMSIRQVAQESLLLREVSSRLFWGLSKLLDGRAEAVAALLGVDECPFLEQPIVLNIHLAEQPTSFLFVENHVAFERLKQRMDLREIALIYSSGFRGAASRLRRVGGCSLYYSRASMREAIDCFERMLFSSRSIPTYFWGDLDFSGMAILASLRSTFPSAEAWEPGYTPMLARLLRGDGHSPAESGKERQRPVERTGCSYADNALLPALRSTGKFVDQE